MELDAGSAPTGAVPEAEICIVGAGPAGLALAAALEVAGKSVILLESGNGELNAGETAGDPYEDLRLVRSRGVGGTAALWNTWFHDNSFAKYLPLDPGDFEPREWLPWSGWPFGRETLEPWYRSAQEVCGLGPFAYDAGPLLQTGLPLLRLGGGPLRNAAYQCGPASRFTRELPARLRGSATVLLLQGATVVELVRNPRGDRITEARWAALPAGRGAVRAGSFVIAAGGIESARLLLLTLGDRPWLGRGFMEHLVDGSLQLLARDPALLTPGGCSTPRRAPSGVPVLGRLGFAPEFLRAERLRNASIRLLDTTTEPALLQSPLLRSLAGRLVPLRGVRRLIGGGVRKLAGLTRKGRPGHYQLLIDLEQGPDPENRVLLSSRRDLLGLPQARLQWRGQPSDLVYAARVRALVASELERAGAGKVVSTGPLPLDPKQHHHAGTTRMHRDPALGVVDESLRVHGMENLFVAGSSVFPTAGVANPTLTVVALALRLAAELASR